MPKPLSDSELSRVVAGVVWAVDPVLDLLAERDPLGLKGRTFANGDTNPVEAIGKVFTGGGTISARARTALTGALDSLTWGTNLIALPGTEKWSTLTVDERSKWWVRRIGSLNNLLVAWPGVLGVIADRLPLTDVLGFTNQALVLCAVAREHGITDHYVQTDLVVSVLCGRNVNSLTLLGPKIETADPSIETAKTAAGEKDSGRSRLNPFPLVKLLWQGARVARSLTGEFARRPQPSRMLRLVGKLPVVGFAGDYLGEWGAMNRAATAGAEWIQSAGKREIAG